MFSHHRVSLLVFTLLFSLSCEFSVAMRQNISSLIDDLAPSFIDVYSSTDSDTTMLDVSTAGILVRPSLSLTCAVVVFVTLVHAWINR